MLVLSQYLELGLAMKLLEDSADGVGYLLKDRVSDVAEFVAAVRRIGTGGSAIDPTIVSRLVTRHRTDDPLAVLTPREREVLELMATGTSNQGIADVDGDLAASGGEVRVERVLEARHPVDGQRVPAGAGGAALPAVLSPSTEHGRSTRNPNPRIHGCTRFPPDALLATVDTTPFRREGRP